VRIRDLDGFVRFGFFTLFSEGLSMKLFRATALLVAAATLLVGSMAAQATIITQGYYHLGEADPGAIAGNGVNATTMDSGGLGKDVNLVGALTYSSDVAPSAAAATGSTMSVANPATGYGYIAPPWTDATDNFGLEGWFKLSAPSADRTDVLAWNGNAAAGNGWGLICYQGTIQGYYSTVAIASSGFTPTANEWFYAALVRDGGVSTMYINDATPIAGLTGAPVTPAGISALCTAGGADGMNGLLDEVRVFTFEPGTFNASTDLLISPVPEPSCLALLSMSLLGLAVHAWQKRK
jgi:hypothetical protein